nr:ABC transporter permease [Rhodococcus sp. 06-418-1B]
MFWVTYRQFRATLLGTLGVIALVGALTLLASLSLRNYAFGSSFGQLDLCYGTGSTACVAQTTLTATTLLTAALPFLIGLFVGVATFSRDIERGTHVLSLSQSVGRLRWYFCRVLIVFVPVVLAMLALGILFLRVRATNNVWSSFSGFEHSRFVFPIFETSALAPAAYTLAALLIGSAYALLLRHTVGAMVLALITTVGLLVLLTAGLRPHYATPLVEARPLVDVVATGEYVSYGSSSRWTVDSNYVDAQGNTLTIDYNACNEDQSFYEQFDQDPDETYAAYEARTDELNRQQIARRADCLAAQGADRFEVEYHLGSQFWRFQATEAALLLTLSALVLGVSTVLVRRLRP